MAEKTLISVVIVDYFKAQRVVENVDQVLAQQGNFDIEVIVIDNSVDEENQKILSRLRDHDNVTLVFNEDNIGYTQASNQGAFLCHGDYLFFVNPDIEWKSPAILREIVEIYKEDPSIGIVGTRQLNDDGTVPDTVRRFPDIYSQIIRRTALRHLPLLKNMVEHYEYFNFDYSKTADVDWIQSSFMAISRLAWEKVHGFDSRYFIFMADPDICYKCWEVGYKVHYESGVVVGADGIRCSAGGFSDIFTNKVLRFHIRDAFAYYFKYFFKPRAPAARIAQNNYQHQGKSI